MEKQVEQLSHTNKENRRSLDKKRKKSWLEKVLDIVIILLVIATVFMLAYRVTTSEAKVVGHSMDNTLANDERIVYEKVTGVIGDYKKGDILILKENTVKVSGDDQSGQIVKRLIAQGGDAVAFTDDGKPIVNGEPLAESYIKEQNTFKIADFSYVIKKTNEKYNTNFDENMNTVPKGYYFVMGDNRNNSSDSRVFGLFKKEDILGRVLYSQTYNHFY